METPADSPFTWENIDWTKVQEHVNKLQFRIAKAVVKGNIYKAKRLQYLLTNSSYAKLLAIKKVTSNKGKNTPGIDGILYRTPKQKLNAALSLSHLKYRSLPLKRTYIEKKGKKAKRPLGIPTMYDRAMQALFALALEPIAETTADTMSFGFRKYRSAHDAREHAFNCLAHKDRAQWILEGDIKGCFDHISHQWLMDNIPLNKKTLKEFLKAGYIYRKKLFPVKAGTPQGGIISPILANMTLDGLEKVIKEQYWSCAKGTIHNRYNRNKVNFIRYADDFIVTAKSKEVALDVKNIIEKFLIERGLTLSEEKTAITHIADGFNFLGWNFRKYHGKLLIKPSKESFKNISQKIRTTVKQFRGMPQKDLIRTLNPIIRGWCNYHKVTVAKEAFKALDTVLFEALWRWGRFRHQNKNAMWIKNRYWKRIENRDWRFCSEDNVLIVAGYTKIIRHIMIKLDKNPFVREDSDYFYYRKRKESF